MRRLRSRAAVSVVAVVVTVGAGVVVAACGGGGAPTITLYNGQHLQLTSTLIAAFEAHTGIQVRVRSDDSIVLADQLIEEGSSSPADVYLSENSPELMALEERHLLSPLPASILTQVPARDRPPSGEWVGVTQRVAALVYNPSLVARSALPSSVLDLAEPQWRGKVALAPTDSDFPPQVGAVIATHGSAAALRWLQGMKTNAVLYQDEEATVAAVNRGQQAVGIVNQYYWYRLRREVGAQRIHSDLYFFPDHDVGSVENVGGAGVMASSAHKRWAEQFVSFLVSAAGQHLVSAGDDFEYPVRPGVAPNAALPPLSEVDPAVVNVVSLGDDRRSVALIARAGLA